MLTFGRLSYLRLSVDFKKCQCAFKCFICKLRVWLSFIQFVCAKTEACSSFDVTLGL